MLIINPTPGPKAPSHLKTLAALHIVSDSPSAFFTTGAPGDAEREELMLGAQLWQQPECKRGYIYLLRCHLGKRSATVMAKDKLAKQFLLAAQLFAQGRNAFAKAGQQMQEYIAYFLAVRCATYSHEQLPAYLEEMAGQYGKTLGRRAENLASAQLADGNVAGFLAMTTIAFSAYEDNTLPLGAAEIERYAKLPARTLNNLNEYLKAHEARLPATEVAIIRQAKALLGLPRLPELPAWLQEVVDKASSRAATTFLQEAAAQDKKRKPAVSAWWWARAADTLALGSNYAAWQQPYRTTAPQEAAKRLGELAVKTKKAAKDFHEYALLTAACHRNVRACSELPASWLHGFEVDELLNVRSGLRTFVKDSVPSSPDIESGLQSALAHEIADSANAYEIPAGVETDNDIKLALRALAEVS